MALVDMVMTGRFKDGGTSASASVAIIQKVLNESGLKNTLYPMSSVVEGDVDDVLAVVGKMRKALIDAGYDEINTQIRIAEKISK